MEIYRDSSIRRNIRKTSSSTDRKGQRQHGQCRLQHFNVGDVFILGKPMEYFTVSYEGIMHCKNLIKENSEKHKKKESELIESTSSESMLNSESLSSETIE